MVSWDYCAYSLTVIHVLSAVLVCFRETGFSESEIRVGFVTYAKELHFYNVKVINNNNNENFFIRSKTSEICCLNCEVSSKLNGYSD